MAISVHRSSQNESAVRLTTSSSLVQSEGPIRSLFSSMIFCPIRQFFCSFVQKTTNCAFLCVIQIETRQVRTPISVGQPV